MKPSRFDYHRASDRSDVDSLLAQHSDEAKVLAGGQSLVPMLNFRLARPEHLVDINHLPDEATVPEADNSSVVFGPLVRQVAAERSDLVRSSVPLLAMALEHVAHPAIRTRGTIVGSIAHADPAAELPAVLVALGGEVSVRSSGSARMVPAAAFFVGPLVNSLDDHEWVDAVRFPRMKQGEGFAFEEFARRSGDYALCGVAAVARSDGDRIGVSLTYLGVGMTPQGLEMFDRSLAAFEDPGLERELADLVEGGLSPHDDIHATGRYKRFLAVRLGMRAARAAARMASGGNS